MCFDFDRINLTEQEQAQFIKRNRQNKNRIINSYANSNNQDYLYR